MKESVTKQLAALRHMTIDELREKFSELFGIETSSFNPQQIRKRLAYRIQEVYYGGLTEPEKAGNRNCMPAGLKLFAEQNIRNDITGGSDGQHRYLHSITLPAKYYIPDS